MTACTTINAETAKVLSCSIVSFNQFYSTQLQASHITALFGWNGRCGGTLWHAPLLCIHTSTFRLLKLLWAELWTIYQLRSSPFLTKEWRILLKCGTDYLIMLAHLTMPDFICQNCSLRWVKFLWKYSFNHYKRLTRQSTSILIH